MARGKRIVATGPSALARLVAHLKAPPKLTLSTYFLPPHFLKEQLPRIRYANPNLDIHVFKMTKKPKDEWRPELKLSFLDGKTQTLNLHAKWSTAIVRELMESAGSPAWVRWKAEAARAGLPLVSGAEHEPTSTEGGQKPEPRFSLEEWRAKHRRRVRRPHDASKSKDATTQARRKKGSKEVKAASPQQPVTQKVIDPEKAKLEDEKRRAAKKEARRARLDAPRLAEEEAERRVALELLSKPRTGAAAVLP
ncbi:hypothetical protein B0H11DRAFT_2002383 [Mycena galericulata]|nr:hypothetical protein B0H11DRAFT_2002383 [Mycena galericulata]